MSVGELRLVAEERKIDHKDVTEKQELVKRLRDKLIKDFNEGNN